MGRRWWRSVVAEDSLSESKGGSGIWEHASFGSSLKYFSGSQRKAGFFTSGSSFRAPMLNDLNAPWQWWVLGEGRKRSTVSWIPQKELAHFQVNFLKCNLALTQLVQLQWSAVPTNTAVRDKSMVLLFKGTKRNSRLPFHFFFFCYLDSFAIFPWKRVFCHFGKAPGSLSSARKLHLLWDGILFLAFNNVSKIWNCRYFLILLTHKPELCHCI